MARRWLLGVAGATVFCSLAILNVGGYRYGVQDQSFYIPSVLQQLDPGLYARDAPVLGAQDGFFVFDEAIAQLVRLSGQPLPVVFFLLFLGGLLLLGGATVATGWHLYGSGWAVAVLTIGLTLRHRISMTGVNTLEAYLHPRMLAFAVGVAAVALYLRGRSWLALAVVLAAAGLHPTMAVWFLLLLGVAVLVSDPVARQPLLIGGALAAPIAIWVAWVVLGDRLVLMDDAWLALLTHKSYLFSTEWTPSAWLANLGTAAILGGVYAYRRREGLVSPQETGLVCGCGALLALFLLSLPLVEMRLAIAVQLQIGRVFWLIDFLALAALAWLVTEPGRWGPSSWSPTLARQVVVGLVLLAALGRGGYVTFVEHPDRPVLSVRPVDDDWSRAMAWIANTPAGSHILADPAHAWRHGTSVRVIGERDVFLEEVKDPALAIYSRDVAQRVLDRVQDLDRFDTLTADRARQLADKYDLHYLVSDRTFALPMAHQTGPFRVYTLRPPPAPVTTLAAAAVR